MIFIFLGCNTNHDSQKLKDYLNKFGRDINDIKVIAFVPVDGCSSCLISTIEYSKTVNDGFLMVLSSFSEKTNDFFIKLNAIDESKIINDTNNLAATMGFVPLTAPRYYFVMNGRIVRSIDFTEIPDKIDVLKKIKNFMDN